MKIGSWGLAVLAAVCVMRLWLMQLPSSFWVDEMATVFVVEHGADHPSLKVAPQVPQSIYYAVVRAWAPGRSEILYRLPSVLFMGLALMFVGLLAARLIHPDAWWFAVFACFALRGIDYEAANARPYAMGMCVAAAGLYFLVRWLDTGKLRDAALFMILGALVWRVHLIFWPFYIVYAMYALWAQREVPSVTSLCESSPPDGHPVSEGDICGLGTQKAVPFASAVFALRRVFTQTAPVGVRQEIPGADRKPVPGWQIAIVFGIVGVSLIPVAMRAIELNRQAREHVVIEQPSWMNLLHSLHLPLVAAAWLGAWIWSRSRGVPSMTSLCENPPLDGHPVSEGDSPLCPPVMPCSNDGICGLGTQKAVPFARVMFKVRRVFTQTRTGGGIARPQAALVAVLGWWLIHPVALFAFSRITGNSVFVPRYLALALPGAAAASALAAAWFLPSRAWKPAALLMGIGALVASGSWTELWPSHHNSDWRAAAKAVNGLALLPSTPVIFPSPFVEARSPVWTPDYEMPGFLYAPLLVYPVHGNAVLFPFVTSPEAQDYAMALLHGAIPASGRFVIYGANGGAHFWRDWFEKRPELAGWRHRSLGDFKDVDVIVFERK